MSDFQEATMGFIFWSVSQEKDHMESFRGLQDLKRKDTSLLS